MKHESFFILLIFSIVGVSLKAQAPMGLENIIVEKYYISTANDTLDRIIGGRLPVGSTTYRVFLDMLPKYRFYAAYGSVGHEMRIETSTAFFNNEDIGNKVPNVIPRRTMVRNTVMLDSWLSAGGAGENYYGVLKEQDDTVGTIVHEKKFLQNTDKRAGIPVKERDGLVAGADVPFPAMFGLDDLSLVFFNSTNGSVLRTTDGAWGCLGGAMGLDSLNTNRVLIGQFTTDGDFSFELNVQIGRKGEIPQLFVAKNQLDGEFTLPCLTYDSRKNNDPDKKSVLSKKTNAVKSNQSK